MREPRDPEAEKAKDYTRQHRIVSGESRHGERKGRPRRRAATHRAHRRDVSRALTAPGGPIDGELADSLMSAAAEAQLPDFVIWKPSTLAGALEYRREYRAAEAGRVYFRQPYDAGRHRQPFGRFLESVVAGGVAPSVELAERFCVLLDSPPVELPKRFQALGLELHGAGRFLHDFLVDEPAWRDRLASWVDATLAEPRFPST